MWRLRRDPTRLVVVAPSGHIRPMTDREHQLSKSRFVAGWQCPKLLWWTVHEPQAPELQPDVVLQDLFDQGHEVGLRAQREWPRGVLIPGRGREPERVPRTRMALDAGARVLFEACFEADGVFCAVDVLERNADGWTLIEVKSSSSVKDYHVPDLAVQAHVVRRAGLTVTRIEVMHLSKAHRHPDQGPLFERSDVTAEVEALVPEVPRRIAEQQAVLALPAVPEREIGPHCFFRNECAFMGRCWPEDPDHIGNLIGVGAVKMWDWIAAGMPRMSAIPESEKLNAKQRRQLRAQKEGRLIVEEGLAEALRPAAEARTLGFLDFETVGRALPPWDGLGPWHNTAAQFSYHERGPDGTMTHAEFLAEGPEDPADPPDDPREPLARAMLEATARADLIVMYTPFEKTQINALAKHLPHLERELHALRDKLWDLKPVIEHHVYHPDFLGSFSLKDVLTPLVPDETYGDDMMIVDGKTASVQIARLLFTSGRIPKREREATRRGLLEYCKKDTYATVRLVARLAELAAG
jgi:hypothetical protein